MKTIERICAHDIEFNYFSRSKKATPSDSEIDHVQSLLIQNCVAGELCMATFINNREYELRGWWKIISELH